MHPRCSPFISSQDVFMISMFRFLFKVTLVNLAETPWNMQALVYFRFMIWINIKTMLKRTSAKLSSISSMILGLCARKLTKSSAAPMTNTPNARACLGSRFGKKEDRRIPTNINPIPRTVRRDSGGISGIKAIFLSSFASFLRKRWKCDDYTMLKKKVYGWVR